MSDKLTHCMCGCIYEEPECPHCNKLTDKARIVELEKRSASLKAKLAKVIILAGAMAEAIEDQIDTCDASMDEQIAVKNYRTTLAAAELMARINEGEKE